MTRSIVQCSAYVSLVLLGMGCASQSDSGTRQLRELGEQVRRLQATTDRMEERLAAIENARLKDVQRPPVPVSLTNDVPNLPVVKVNPDAGALTDGSRPTAGDADESRPLIVGEGTRIETRSSGAEPPGASVPLRRSKDKSAVESTSPNATTGRRTQGRNHHESKHATGVGTAPLAVSWAVCAQPTVQEPGATQASTARRERRRKQPVRRRLLALRPPRFQRRRSCFASAQMARRRMQRHCRRVRVRVRTWNRLKTVSI